MINKDIKDKYIVIRVTQKEKDKYENKAKRKKFKSLSSFATTSMDKY